MNNRLILFITIEIIKFLSLAAYYMISGQNLGTEYSTKPFSTDKIFTFSVNRVQSWYDELAYMPPDIINSYQSQVLDDDDKGYGHAAAMLNERTNRIGCAVCQYKAIRSGRDFNATGNLYYKKSVLLFYIF